jgi:hypothetical protein
MQLLQEKDMRELRQELKKDVQDYKACNMQGLLVEDAFEEDLQECKEGIMIWIAERA